MSILGELSVAIYDSDPELGDESDFVFFMELPYTAEQLTRKSRAMMKIWVDTQKRHGLTLRSQIRFRGPWTFFQTDRIDLGTKRSGDDEYRLTAMFRHDKPRIVRSSVIDMWEERRKGIGAPVYPVHDIHDDMPVSGRMFKNENDWEDKPQSPQSTTVQSTDEETA